MSGTTGAEVEANQPIRKFNPGMLQSDKVVVEQFVVRQHELDVVLDVLRSNIGAPSCQHLLAVAPRGRGKTMLLARVAAEIRGKAELGRHLLPVRFMEESQEIYGLADFWLETLFHLAREVAADNPALASDLSKTHASLSSRWREVGMEGTARAAVLDAADRLDRRLVLMVENVQSLLSTVDDQFGWGLRGVLQSVPQVMLVASATCRFDGLEDPRAPFFELFRFVHLAPLTTAECRRLWAAVTGQAPHTHEIRPLEILTGGSPRLLVVVAAFARHRSLRQLMEELVGLVDEHTEYFRGHLESLPKNERRVFVSLSDLWQASSTGEISARARLDVRVVSTMLGRLVEKGAVTVMADADGGKRLYAASERLYSIYYKLRRERDEAAVVEALIHFMVAFYDVGELYRVSDQLLRDAIDSRAIQAGMDRALARRGTLLDDLPSRIKWEEVERISGNVRDQRHMDAMVRLQESVQAAYKMGEWKRVLEIVECYVADGWVDRAAGWRREHEWARVRHLRSDAHLGLEQFREVIVIGEEVAQRLGDTNEVALLGQWSAMALNKAAAYYGLGDFDSARSESRDVVERFGKYGSPWYDVQVAAALVLQAEADNKLGSVDGSIALLDEVLERFGESDDADVQRSVARSLVVKGGIVRMQLDDHRRAAEIYGEAVERFGNSKHPEVHRSVNSARMNRAFAYGSSGDFEEELAAYDDVISLLDGSETSPGERWSAFVALMYKSRRLAELGRAKQALSTCEETAGRIDEGTAECPGETLRWMDWHVRGTRALALMSRRESAAAMEAFRSACALFQPHHEIAMREMLRLVPELIAAGALEGDLIDVLGDDDRRSAALQPMIVALRQRTGESVRAPVEVLEVAADLGQCIENRVATGIMPGFMHRSGRD